MQSEGWPPGERAGVGKAWASGFQARAMEPLDLLAPIFLGIFSPFSRCDKQTLYRLSSGKGYPYLSKTPFLLRGAIELSLGINNNCCCLQPLIGLGNSKV